MLTLSYSLEIIDSIVAHLYQVDMYQVDMVSYFVLVLTWRFSGDMWLVKSLKKSCSTWLGCICTQPNVHLIKRTVINTGAMCEEQMASWLGHSLDQWSVKSLKWDLIPHFVCDVFPLFKVKCIVRFSSQINVNVMWKSTFGN